MDPGLRERLRAGAGSVNDWFKDREEDFAAGLAGWEARGHELFGRAIRKGEDVVARTTSELRDFERNNRRPSKRPAPTQPRQAAPGRSRERQILENAERLTREGARRAAPVMNSLLKQQVGHAGLAVGNVEGAVAGGAQMIGNLKDDTVLGLRLLNPADPFTHPKGEAAWDKVLDGAANIVNNVVATGTQLVDDPIGAAGYAVEKARQWRRELDPTATPAAPTLEGEFGRARDIGRNQGRVLVNVAPYAIGLGEARSAQALASMSKAEHIANYVAQGLTPENAAHLAEPYVGAGHHAILPRRARLPNWMGGGPIPKLILDSPFNVLKPEGMTRGQFYELHYKVDPYFKGARLKGSGGKGSGWSGARLGLQEYGLPERIWYGTPNATKQAVAATGIAGSDPFEIGQGQ